MSLPTLNEQQTQAVAHRDGPCIVLAGPGAGKTAVLTRRAAELVRSGVPAERVLLLTFTSNSAKEMLARAKAIEPGCAALSGGTFHSVATRIINRNAHVFGADKPFTILDPDDCRSVVKKLMDPLKIDGENWPQASTVYKVISYATNTRSSIHDSVQRLVREHLALADRFQEVRDEYVSYKLNRQLLDYDDCLEYLAALLEDPDIGPMIRAQWDYCLFDEYQDTNQLQLQIVYGLVGGHRNMMIVGDPSQSIYGFRGSAPATMTGFQDRFPDARVIKLETNYRSSPEIVAMVNAIDRSIATGFDRTLRSATASSGIRPVFLESADDTSQASEIGKSILSHKEQGGELADVAILVRSMSYARRIEVELTSRKIPYRVVGGLRIDEAAHVKDLLSLARIATNAAHEPAWLRVLARHKRIGDVAASQIAERVSMLAQPEEAPIVLEREAVERGTSFEGLPDALRVLMDQNRDPADALADAIQIMDPFWRTVKEWKDDWDDRLRDLEAILLIAAEHRTLDSFLTAITLDYSVDQKKRSEGPKDDERPVTISTVHGAKGLEWPVVHIPFFVRGHMPSVFSDDQDEELRILYVAVSRAMRELIIHRPQFNAKGEFTTPSDFERMVRPHCLVERATQPSVRGGAVATDKRIDMRSRLLRKD